jgi:SAM-dependent methyltransferase
LDLQKQASKYYWYHSVDLGNGVIIDGDYDIREVLLHYGFPERMDGMDVLDVGRGSGFFAFEFERRGAAVTATDICSFLDWDFVGGDEQREARRKAIGDEQGFAVEHITGAFEFAGGAKPARPISEGTASGSARGRVGRLARWHGLCERLIRFIGQIWVNKRMQGY